MSISKHIKEHAVLGITQDGAKVLSVGVSGSFPTIQAAVDYIETQDAFTPITNMLTDGIVSASTPWAQGASTFLLSTTATTSTAAFVMEVNTDRVWVKAAGDTYHYKLEGTYDVVLSTQQIQVAQRRHEVATSGAVALSWFKENRFIIKLLDDTDDADFTISDDVFITFVGNGSTNLAGKVKRTTDFKQGCLTFKGLVVGSAGTDGMFSTAGSWDSANNITLECLDSEVATIENDWIFPSAYLGEFKATNTIFTSQPTAVQGHCIAPKHVAGDIICLNVSWKPVAHTANRFTSNILFCDLPTGGGSARNIIINGLSVYVRDQNAGFQNVNIFGNSTNTVGTANIFINDVCIIAPDSATTNFNIIQIAAVTTGMAAQIGTCSIISSTSGTIKLVDAPASIAGASTVLIGRGNSTVIADKSTNLTYVVEPAGASGSGSTTAASSDVITHGLGYTPLAEDINVVLTADDTGVSFIITSITDTSFTVTLSASATTAFKWRIE